MVSEVPPSRLRFGAFEIDRRTGEVRRQGVGIRLAAQPFQVLSALAERPGELVTREELRRRLWPSDTFVDFEHGINSAIKKLRQALGDKAEAPVFIQTLPGRGYRFVQPVEVVVESAESVTSPERARPEATAAKLRTRAAVVGAAAAAVIAVVLPLLLFRAPVEKPPSSIKLVPLTAFPGQEVAPSFSPDGTRVAFAWTGDTPGSAEGFDLYTEVIGTDRPLRLTAQPAAWIAPAWSPDGRSIAFSRVSAEGEGGIYVVSAHGGAERKLVGATFASFWVLSAPALSWSPDGSLLAYSEVSPGGPVTMWLLSMENLQKTRINPSLACQDAWNPTFSPDGKRLAFGCSSSIGVWGIYVQPLAGGAATRVASEGGFPGGLCWTPDGTRIAYAASTHPGSGGELWQVSATGGHPERLLFAQDALSPAFSVRGNRLAYARRFETTDIWRIDRARHPPHPQKLIASSRIQENPQLSPDGSKIAFESTRSGSREIWISDGGGHEPVQLTSFGHSLTGTPRWSPDGRRVVFDSRAGGRPDLYVADVPEGVPHRLNVSVADDSLGSWSRDGRWIYFLSPSGGSYQIWKVPSEGGAAIQVTRRGGWHAFESPDGRRLYYGTQFVDSEIWSVPTSGGDEAPVPGMPHVEYSAWWVPTAAGIYFITQRPAPAVRFFDFATRAVKEIATLPGPPAPYVGGISASSDGRYILYSQVDETASDIMLVDGFF
jgi:Tol biopolymer transport system component/DNA-binding winged helix-turn-helix (wHTH) protein